MKSRNRRPKAHDAQRPRHANDGEKHADATRGARSRKACALLLVRGPSAVERDAQRERGYPGRPRGGGAADHPGARPGHPRPGGDHDHPQHGGRRLHRPPRERHPARHEGHRCRVLRGRGGRPGRVPPLALEGCHVGGRGRGRGHLCRQRGHRNRHGRRPDGDLRARHRGPRRRRHVPVGDAGAAARRGLRDHQPAWEPVPGVLRLARPVELRDCRVLDLPRFDLGGAHARASAAGSQGDRAPPGGAEAGARADRPGRDPACGAGRAPAHDRGAVARHDLLGPPGRRYDAAASASGIAPAPRGVRARRRGGSDRPRCRLVRHGGLRARAGHRRGHRHRPPLVRLSRRRRTERAPRAAGRSRSWPPTSRFSAPSPCTIAWRAGRRATRSSWWRSRRISPASPSSGSRRTSS